MLTKPKEIMINKYQTHNELAILANKLYGI